MTKSKTQKFYPFDPASVEIKMPKEIHPSVPTQSVLPLLRAVAKAEALPETFDMTIWADRVQHDEQHPCGTTACLAGTVVQLERPALFKRRLRIFWDGHNLQDDAQKILGLSDDQQDVLFFVSGWPAKFARRYGYIQGVGCFRRGIVPRKAQVKVAALRARVDHFIKTGK